jgi:hypothetical protein
MVITILAENFLHDISELKKTSGLIENLYPGEKLITKNGKNFWQ